MNAADRVRRELLEEFRRSTLERVEKITFAWLTLEKDPNDAATVEQLLRELHSLKGEAKMMGFADVSLVAHRAEDLVIAAKQLGFLVDDEFGDILLAAADGITALMEKQAGSQGSAVDLASLTNRIEVAIERSIGQRQSEVTASPRPAAAPPASSGGAITAGGTVVGADGAGAVTEAATAGASLASRPAEATTRSADAAAHAADEGGGERAAAAGAAGAAGTSATAGASSTAKGEATFTADRFMRVDVELLTAFSNGASEATVAHARYGHSLQQLRELSHEMEAWLASADLWSARAAGRATALVSGMRAIPVAEAAATGNAESVAVEVVRTFHRRLEASLTKLREDIYQGALQARELAVQARRLRLIPIATLLNKFVRPTRDLAREHGKVVSVQVIDNAVMLDRHVAEVIGEPLLHLVRNAVDHAIEKPEERRQKGKPEEGTIRLSAHQEGGYVVIAIEDDGAGIDLDRVRQRAVEMGMLSAGEVSALTQEETLGLLFRSGFSTRSEATATSGRGVGLDVVKRNVERIGGAVRVGTTLGVGSRFDLRVPLAVALTRVLVMRVGAKLYALPSSAVEGIIDIDPSQIEQVHSHRAVRFRGETPALIDLGDFLEEGSTGGAGGRAVIVRHEGAWAAFLVSSIDRDADVVVKPLGQLLEHATLFTGGSILEEGALALVLNPAQLVPRALGRGLVVGTTATRPEETQQRKTILLVEDSAITRTMVAGILVAFGYDVEQAGDGREGLRVVGAKHIDLVLTDIDMPVMDGIELTRRLRAEPAWRTLPIVVLSTRGSDPDKKRALEAGADAYLVKTQFSEKTLRDVVARGLGV